MTLSPLETEELKIKSFPAKAQTFFSLEYALKKDVTNLLALQIQYYKDQKALFNEEVEDVTFVGFDGSSITV